ncbi:MAG TPA: YbdK family carboxylate-amine ligase [Baekduia sp.]|nr:YbdK family carboxylate-amine ligase [Baekduia sp.]
MSSLPNPDAEALRAAFQRDRGLTVGLEEELMLLDPETLDLTPCAPPLLTRLGGDERYKPELPAAQLEIVGRPAATVPEAAAQLLQARRDLVRAAKGLARPAGAGVHQFAQGIGVISPGERYDRIVAEFGGVARRQLVFGLHVHVALSGADRALAVYNAVREELPALAALAGASPFYEGRDTGLASVRPKLSELLPRQGVPPAFSGWEALARALSWGRDPGAFADACWWWEARLHPVYGTIEIRVPDTQATVRETAAVAAVVHALVATLAARHDAGDLPPPAETWQIAENRWSACRYGVAAPWVDPRAGTTTTMRQHLHGLLDSLREAAEHLGCGAELIDARAGVDDPAVARARATSPQVLAASLAERFLAV